MFFWNSRNARRKQSGTLIFWFKEFLDKVGKDKAFLLMHTDPKDPHGQDLTKIMEYLGLTNGEVMISQQKLGNHDLNRLLNAADCTLSASDAEGFGLSTFESLSSGTPIIVTMTGGLQEQVTDGENWFGVGVEPCSKAIIGSQDIPYIYEDRLNKEQYIDAMVKIFNMSPKDRVALGLAGRDHVIKNYSHKDFKKRWVEIMDNVHKTHGSHKERKNFNGIRFERL